MLHPKGEQNVPSFKSNYSIRWTLAFCILRFLKYTPASVSILKHSNINHWTNMNGVSAILFSTAVWPQSFRANLRATTNIFEEEIVGHLKAALVLVLMNQEWNLVNRKRARLRALRFTWGTRDLVAAAKMKLIRGRSRNYRSYLCGFCEAGTVNAVMALHCCKHDMLSRPIPVSFA